jgi:hypothetical protein
MFMGTLNRQMPFSVCGVAESGTTRTGRKVSDGEILCFGRIQNEIINLYPSTDTGNPKNPLYRQIFVQQSSCKTSIGPSSISCTTCPSGKHLTVMTPATSSGACSQKKDQYYRRKECCKVDEKHFVQDAATLLGICVPQDNDCAPFCIDQKGTKICSKGCNVLLPYDDNTRKTKAQKKRMVVCDSHKMVSCSPPPKTSSDIKGKAKAKVLCIAKQEKQVTARMSCDFDRDIWALGATCISRVFTHNLAQASKNSGKLTKIPSSYVNNQGFGAALELFADVKAGCGRPGVSLLKKLLSSCEVVPEDASICSPMAMSY